MKKFVSILMILTLLVCICGCTDDTAPVSSSPVESVPEETVPQVVKTDSGVEDRVLTLGRTAVSERGIWTSWSGSGVEFEFEGTDACATVFASLVFGEEHPMLMGVFIDGSDTAKKTFTVTSEKTEVTLCENLKEGKHTLKLLKLSEAQYGSVCIEDIKAENMSATTPKERTFEFIGDSIICGNGTGASSSRGEFKTSEQNVALTAGYLIAEKYGAASRFICATDYNTDSVSSGGKQIAEVYKRTAPFLMDQVGVGEGEYDFHDPADMVFINIGSDRVSKITTNEQKAVFKSEYVNLVKLVREKNPDAEIFILCGTFTYLLEDEVQAVYEQLKEDTKLHYFRYSFESLLVYSGLTAGYPSAHSNERMYKELIKEMKALGFKPE